MPAVALGRLLTDPAAVALDAATPEGASVAADRTGAEARPSWLRPELLRAPGGHPLVRAIRRAAESGSKLWRVALADGADFVNLGRGSAGGEGAWPEAGLALVLNRGPDRRPDAEAGAGGRRRERAAGRATWLAWGLPRPAVNLFLAPELARASARLGRRPDLGAATELLASSSFRDRRIHTSVRVEHVMAPLKYRIYPDMPLAEVQHLVLRRRLDEVPVVGRRHELLGIITCRDILRHVLPGSKEGASRTPSGLVARDIMTRSVLCVAEREKLTSASRSLVARGVPAMPVVTGGRLVGFLPGETVMRAFAPAFVSAQPPTMVAG